MLRSRIFTPPAPLFWLYFSHTFTYIVGPLGLLWVFSPFYFVLFWTNIFDFYRTVYARSDLFKYGMVTLHSTAFCVISFLIILDLLAFSRTIYELSCFLSSIKISNKTFSVFPISQCLRWKQTKITKISYFNIFSKNRNS